MAEGATSSPDSGEKAEQRREVLALTPPEGEAALAIPGDAPAGAADEEVPKEGRGLCRPVWSCASWEGAVRWVRSSNPSVVGKYLTTAVGLTAMIIVGFTNAAGKVNLKLAIYNGTFWSRLVLSLAIGLCVFSLRVAAKAVCCWYLSLTAERSPISLRSLLFHCYVWNDYDDLWELGPVLTFVAMLIGLVPVFVSVLATQGYSTSVQLSRARNFSDGTAAGLGGIVGNAGDSVVLLASNELFPNETRRMLQQPQPRFFCASLSSSPASGALSGTSPPGVFVSEVQIPTWPIPTEQDMGDSGERLSIGPVEAFVFTSSCGPGDMFLPEDLFGSDDNLTKSSLYLRDTVSGVHVAAVERIAPDNASLEFYLKYNFVGNMSCLSTVRRGLVNATWIFNSTGYYLDQCWDVQPRALDRFVVDFKAVDTWLNLTYRNTIKHVVWPFLKQAAASGMDPASVAEYKVRVTWVHVVAWLFASSRDGDPTHDPKNSPRQSGAIFYSVQPLREYYTMSVSVLVLLLATGVIFYVSACCRMTRHGFHGGSFVQILFLCRSIAGAYHGWRDDLFRQDASRIPTTGKLCLRGDEFVIPEPPEHGRPPPCRCLPLPLR